MASHTFSVLTLIISVAFCATVQWTGRGGTNLWDNPQNWDCGSCLPTLNDQVIIAYGLGATYIRIGAPAKAGSLIIGGSGTTFFQTLTVSGSLTIGSGVLNTNGALLIETGPNAPFNITGNFVANGRGLAFTSGLLGGNGTLQLAPGAFMNFSGPAAKEIAGNLKIDGSATVASNSGSSIFIKERGSIVVNGVLDSKTALDIIVESSASFSVASNGSFSFNGPKLLLQGPFNLGQWSVSNGAVTVINKLTSGALTLGASSSISLIGGPTETRSFASISGGSINQQGGATTFGNIDIAGLAISGGVASFSGQTSKVGQLAVTGGSLVGGAVNAASSVFEFGVFSGATQVTTSSLDLRGIVTLQDAKTSLTVSPSGQARVSLASQVTLQPGTAFTLSAGSTMSQTAPLKLVLASPTGPAPALFQNGAWTSSAALTSLGVPITGRGSFSLTNGAVIDLTNADFSADTMTSAGSFTFQQGNINVGTVTGAGSFSGSPNKFTSNSLAAASFTLSDGAAQITKSNLSKLKVSNGVFTFSATTVGTLELQGGTVSGTDAKSTATVGALAVTGTPAKTIASCTMTISSLSLNCAGTAQCALFTVGATLSTK